MWPSSRLSTTRNILHHIIVPKPNRSRQSICIYSIFESQKRVNRLEKVWKTWPCGCKEWDRINKFAVIHSPPMKMTFSAFGGVSNAIMERKSNWTSLKASSPCAVSAGEQNPSEHQKDGRQKRKRSGIPCPHCGQICYRAAVFYKHMERCAPDLIRYVDTNVEELMSSEVMDSEDPQKISRWLCMAKDREDRLREKALQIAFRQVDAEGNPIRQGPQEIALQLEIPVPRAERLLKFALRAVPMPADNDPVDILYEDDAIIGLDKPSGVITAPKHRYIGGSMVNRLKGYLNGVEPAVVHRLDMNTTGVVIFAKDRVSL